jgi:hypothetical protein
MGTGRLRDQKVKKGLLCPNQVIPDLTTPPPSGGDKHSQVDGYGWEVFVVRLVYAPRVFTDILKGNAK